MNPDPASSSDHARDRLERVTMTGAYDHLDRLTHVSPGHGGGESLRYEYAGDRLVAAWTTGVASVRRLAFGYDDQSNLSAVSTYDASGRSITQTVCMVHDALGRLVVVGRGVPGTGGPDVLTCRTEGALGEVTARYEYDALNRRVSRTEASGTTHFAFLPGGETVGEYRAVGGAWQAVREYVWLDGRPVAQEEHPSATERYTYYVHADQIGLPRALTNASGQVVWRATARPYGEIEETSFGDPASGGTVVTNLRLPGQYDERLLGSLGLQGPYYNWNRWYLPSLGRYLELDPIAKAGGFNGFYGPNWYGYAEGNPLTWTDTMGLYACTYSISTHTMNCIPNNPDLPEWHSNDYVAGNNNIPGCMNNPACFKNQNVGPLPPGIYGIGPRRPDDPRRRDLTDIFRNFRKDGSQHRDGFQTHHCGNTSSNLCSQGCIATPDYDSFNYLMDFESDNILLVTP